MEHNLSPLHLGCEMRVALETKAREPSRLIPLGGPASSPLSVSLPAARELAKQWRMVRGVLAEANGKQKYNLNESTKQPGVTNDPHFFHPPLSLLHSAKSRRLFALIGLGLPYL
jgi:hypothetical protein